MKISEETFRNVANAIQKLCSAASEQYTKDCYLYAALAKELLNDKQIKSRIKVGFAAWRVGDGDGDVISHYPQLNAPILANAEYFHAWLVVDGDDGEYIFDITTSQLRHKAQALDAIDGYRTDVKWAPAFLLAPRDTVSSYRAVAQGNAGLYSYEENEDMQNLVTARSMPIDAHDIDTARFLMKNSDMVVIGNNHRAVC